MDHYLELVSQGKEAYIDKACNIGWFDYSSLTAENVAKRLADIKDNKSFLFALSEMSFDAEGFESAEDYQSVLSELLQLSQELKNTTLNCEFDESYGVQISIQGINGLYRHQVDLEEYGDWFDPNTIEQFLNETVLPGEGCNCRFLGLPPDDQGIHIVFVPEDIYEKAIDSGLIPQDMGYFMVDDDY